MDNINILLKCFVFICLITIVSCDGDGHYDKKTVWNKALKADPNLQLILPSDQYPAVDCNLYGSGCMMGLHVKVKSIHMIVIRFESEKSDGFGGWRVGLFGFRDSSKGVPDTD